MTHLRWTLLAVAALAAAGKQTFTGIVTDDMCPKANHSQMQMGPTDAECALACISVHGATYVLYNGKTIYTLSDQQKAEQFAGKTVKVTGTLDAKSRTIHVASIALAK
jgi:hypothetical protein